MLRLASCCLLAVLCGSAVWADSGKHLFILSGQSNMGGLKPDESFTPAVEKAFGKDNVVVVYAAWGGQPIRRWYKNWKPEKGDAPDKLGDLYDQLMEKVEGATKDHEFASATFIWMQGERDAREQHGNVYEASLQGLCDQVSKDLGRDDLKVVIGRLSDHDMENKRYKHWTLVRDVQVHFAESYPSGAWVDCDDLNDGTNRRGKPIKNDLHYSAEGYKVLGERFAAKAIELIGG